MSTVLQILAAALLSGLLATGISIWIGHRYELRTAKLRLFQQLLGTRHVLLPGPHDVVAATAFAEAINQIFLMFHDAPDVILALKYFHESISEQASSQELRNQRLLELFKSMAKHLEIETDVLGEGFFMRAFTVNSLLPPQSLHLEFNVVQLLDGQPVLTGWQFFSNSQKAPIVLPAQAARLLACALLELAALAAERDQDLRSGRAVQIGELGQDFVQRVERRRAANA